MDEEVQQKVDAVWRARDRGNIDTRTAGRQVFELLGHPLPRIDHAQIERLRSLRAQLKGAGVYDDGESV